MKKQTRALIKEANLLSLSEHVKINQPISMKANIIYVYCNITHKRVRFKDVKLIIKFTTYCGWYLEVVILFTPSWLLIATKNFDTNLGLLSLRSFDRR